MRHGLTPKELELFQYLKSYRREFGVSPSYQEMAAAIGVKSKSNIARLVGQLRHKGWVRHAPGHRRSIIPSDEDLRIYFAPSRDLLRAAGVAVAHDRDAAVAMFKEEGVAIAPAELMEIETGFPVVVAG